MPAPTVQVLLDDGTRTWQHDVTAFVRLADGITINRGRQDEFADVQPSICSLTLDNTAGTFKPTTVNDPNLLGNGSFEVSTAGWSIDANVTSLTQTGAAAQHGTKAAAITCTTAGVDSKIVSDPFAVTAGQVYAVMGYFRAATTGRFSSVGFRWINAAGGTISTTFGASAISTTGGFIQRTHTPVTAPAGAVQGRVVLAITAPAAGEVHYVDAVYAIARALTGGDTYQNPALPTRVDTGLKVRVTVNGVTTDRFTGLIGSWPTSWPGGGQEFATATVTATDRLPRLGRRKLRSVLENEVLAVRPSLYYLLSEGSSSTSAGDTSGQGRAAATVATFGAGGAIAFGGGTGPRTDGHTATTFTPATLSDYSYLSAPLSGFGSLTSAWLRVAVSTSVAQSQKFARVSGGPAGEYLEIGVNAVGQLAASIPFAPGVGDSVSLADGLVHDVVVVVDEAAGELRLYRDGVLVDTEPLGGAVSNQLRPTRVTIGANGLTSTPTQGSLSHVAFGTGIPSAAQIADWYTAGSDGFTADSSDERIARIARYANLATADLALEAGDTTSVAALDTDGMSPVEAMQRVARSEQGLLFVDGTGTLVFHARSHRYSPTIGVTLDAADVDPGTGLSRDTQGLVNFATATRPGGATQAYENAASVARYEQYPDSLDMLVTTDDEALQAAAWRVNTHAEPLARIPSLPVDLLTADAALAAQVQALELGSALTASGLPSQADASSLTVFAEGWSEVISLSEWSQTFNTSPLVTVWTLEDPVSGALDSTFRLAY